MIKFDYDKAFSRNIGLLSKVQQDKIRASRVAIAGLGGMGGGHAVCLARLGFSRFHIADLDSFDLANFNRQLGATMSSIGESKAETIAGLIKDINPEAEITIFNKGIQQDNIDSFLTDVDVVVDAIDFFQMGPRKLLYFKTEARGVPTVFTAPLGYSSTIVTFAKGGMSFSDYYQIYDETSYFDSLVSLVAGIAPAGLHWSYMNVSIEEVLEKRGPSLALACFLGHSLMATEVLAHLVGTRTPLVAPHSVQLDLLKGIYRRKTLRFGNASPIQKLKRILIAKKFEPFRDQIEANEKAKNPLTGDDVA